MKDIVTMTSFRWFMLGMATAFVLVSMFWYINSNAALGELTVYGSIISIIAFILDTPRDSDG